MKSLHPENNKKWSDTILGCVEYVRQSINQRTRGVSGCVEYVRQSINQQTRGVSGCVEYVRQSINQQTRGVSGCVEYVRQSINQRTSGVLGCVEYVRQSINQRTRGVLGCVEYVRQSINLRYGAKPALVTWAGITAVWCTLNAEYRAINQQIGQALGVKFVATKTVLEMKRFLKKILIPFFDWLIDWLYFYFMVKMRLPRSLTLKIFSQEEKLIFLPFRLSLWLSPLWFIPVEKVEKKVAGTEKCEWKAKHLDCRH